MKKLTNQETEATLGGTITGAFLNGIAKIIDSSCKGFSTIVGTLNNTLHTWIDKPHVKTEVKFGDTTMKIDDSKRLDFEKELLKHDERVMQESFDNQRFIAKSLVNNHVLHMTPIEVHHLAEEPVYPTEVVDENHEFHAEIYQENYNYLLI